MTPNSGEIPYLTVDQLFCYIDPDFISQAFAVRGRPVPTAEDLRTDPRLAAILAAVSGELEAAALIGERYLVADLFLLNGNSKAYLQNMLSDLVVYRCYARKDGNSPPDNVVKRYEQAAAFMERIRLGEEIFAFVEVAAAGLPFNINLTPLDHIQRGDPSYYYRRWLGTRLDYKVYPFEGL